MTASARSCGNGDAATRSRHVDAFSRNGYGFSPGAAAGVGGNGSGSGASFDVFWAMSGARREVLWSQRRRRSSGESARHAVTLCRRRIAASNTPMDPSRNTRAGETAAAAAAAALAAASSLTIVARLVVQNEELRLRVPVSSRPLLPPTEDRVLRLLPSPIAVSLQPRCACPACTSARTASVTPVLMCPSSLDASEGKSSPWSRSKASSASQRRKRNDTSLGGRRGAPVSAPPASHVQNCGWSASRARDSTAARIFRRGPLLSAGMISSLWEMINRSCGACTAATAARPGADCARTSHACLVSAAANVFAVAPRRRESDDLRPVRVVAASAEMSTPPSPPASGSSLDLAAAARLASAASSALAAAAAAAARLPSAAAAAASAAASSADSSAARSAQDQPVPRTAAAETAMNRGAAETAV